jgi:hypothetical protein
VVITVKDPDLATDQVTVTIMVTQENADVTYTGDMLVFTAPSGSSAAVLLQATVRDSSVYTADGEPGDIRNATVSFYVDASPTPASGCSARPVTLINGVTTVGTASCTTTINGLDAHTISIVVNNYYTGSGAGVVEIAQPNGSFITGGGYLNMASSAGQYKADVGTKMNFGFNVKYNKNMTNYQGHVNIVFRADGKVYQIKSTAIDQLGITLKNPANTATCVGPPKLTLCWGRANFRSKANLTDVTNPLSPISWCSSGACTLVVSMIDKGEPGSSDTFAVTLWKGSTLMFSSEWTGASTAEKPLGGGNLVVH